MRTPFQKLDHANLPAVTEVLPLREPSSVNGLPLRSADLFRNGQNERLIEHRGEFYRLRLTRQDKLILNK